MLVLSGKSVNFVKQRKNNIAMNLKLLKLAFCCLLACAMMASAENVAQFNVATYRAGSTISVNHQVAWLGVIFGLRRRSVLDVRD